MVALAQGSSATAAGTLVDRSGAVMAGVAASGQAVAGAASLWGGVQGVLVGASVDSALEAVEVLGESVSVMRNSVYALV